MPKPSPAPEERAALLHKARSLKMARSAHAYVRGNTVRFYDWLDAKSASSLPQGPAAWICGDCHVGNLGPVANAAGKVEIQIRDFDQTVIGNPAHDLVRLGLSLAMAARSSDLPGVTTALMIEQMMAGYCASFEPDAPKPGKQPRPQSVHVALKAANERTWRHLAEERLGGRTIHMPLGKRFWKTTDEEHRAIAAMCDTDAVLDLVTALSHREDGAKVQFLDAAYWKKGCSSLGKLRYAAMLDVGGRVSTGHDLCLVDIKEAVKAAAPRYKDAEMPREYAQRVVEGARHLSPHLGERMTATRMIDRSVFVRELLPEDLKLEIEHIRPGEARRTARYLALVVGRAHARQLDEATRASWRAELRRGHGKTLEAPSWLWSSVIDLVGSHEQGYLEHCRRYALDSEREIEEIRQEAA